jgi:predicted P-loop ATPase
LLRDSVLVKNGLTWDKEAKTWTDRDDANLRGYIEQFYDVSGKDKIKDALDIIITRNSIHPIREYLKPLKWDGVKRLERVIIDYLGAEDTELNRYMTKLHFAAAVARVIEPGCKYDYCLILAGPQGVGKSTFIAIMGGEWYKDGITSIEGKEGAEQVKGTWLLEFSELAAMQKAEIATLKQFITVRVDEFRAAYATRKSTYHRQNVFFGTTNDNVFLRDDTGNRRFPIISIDPNLRKHGIHWFDELAENRNQLWAEAKYYYEQGIKLFLPADMEKEMNERASNYLDTDEEMANLVRAFLDKKLPVGWSSWPLYRRRAFFSNPDPLDAVGTEQRNVVCVAEFICERLGYNIGDKEYKKQSRLVNKIISAEGWLPIPSSRHVEALYGRQRAYARPGSTECQQKNFVDKTGQNDDTRI